jgi:CubicO group peptidase (beta-lactamase class C family)
MYCKPFSNILVLLVLSVQSNAQDIPGRLDSFFNSLYAYKEINGNVLIAENGNAIYRRSFGYANFPNKTLHTEHSEFILASVSKVFTSVAVLQLRDKGMFKLDEHFVMYFPDFPYPDITIRNLLSHTSGLPDYQLYEELIAKNPEKIFSNKDVIPSLKIWKHPLNFKPSEKWNYSNNNFCLLALLVEKVSGLPFEKYLQKNIFSSAKMADTYFLGDSLHKVDKNRTIGYDYPFLFSTELQDVDSIKKYRWIMYNASGFVGQGGIITTSGDMLKFDNSLYSGKILNPSTLQEAFTPTKLKSGENANADIGIGKASYGLGWFIFEDSADGKIVWHGGGRPGSVSFFLRNITKKQTVILFDNAFNKSLYGNAVNALAILNNKPVTFRKKSLVKEYNSALADKGVDAAFCRLGETQADSAHYFLSEDDMNELGLQLLYAGKSPNHNQWALEILKLNTLLFPKSFNTYDSYAEALSNTGHKDEAIFMYKKSLELNPGNEGGKKALNELLKK